MTHFNAILIGGPPHSGKSVLTYSLTQALRRQGIEHYVLRACPDGEGDWSNEAAFDTVRLIRQKGRFTSDFVRQVTNDLGRRHLPLLVDVGGRPQPEQEIIFAQCTHAILVAQDEAGLTFWRSIVERNGLSVIAEVLSLRQGSDAIISNGSSLHLHLTGLERHSQVKGPVFDALALRAANYLYEPAAALRRLHLDSAPVELAVDLLDLAHQLGVSGASPYWTPEQLPKLLDYLPTATDLGVYGRGPNWLYAALAVHAQEADFYQFDVRLGWVKPPRVMLGEPPTDGLLSLQVTQGPIYQLLRMAATEHYLDYTECSQIVVPPVNPSQGLILSGRVPHWLTAALAVAYRNQPWLAMHQPQLHNCAVVVASRTADRAVGDLIALDFAVS